VDDVITGCVYQIGEQGFNLARMGVLSSRLPVTLGGISVNRQCRSSLKIISWTSPSKPVQFYGEVK
jgi:acetyl-CoA acetyltransferase